MPIRFSTEAANADILGEDPQPGGTPEGLPQATERAPAEGSDRATSRDTKSGEARTGEVKPGKDINAAGFVKDKDAGKP